MNIKTLLTAAALHFATSPVMAVNYDYVDGGVYVYRTDGAAATTVPTVRIAYLGTGKGGKATVGLVDVWGRASLTFSCSSPCKKIKIQRRPGGVEYMDGADGSLGAAIMEDALNGELSVYPYVKELLAK